MWFVGTLALVSNGNDPGAEAVGWPVQRALTRALTKPGALFWLKPKNVYVALQSSVMAPTYSIAQLADQSPEFHARLMLPRCFGVPPVTVVPPMAPRPLAVPDSSWLLRVPLPNGVVTTNCLVNVQSNPILKSPAEVDGNL